MEIKPSTSLIAALSRFAEARKDVRPVQSRPAAYRSEEEIQKSKTLKRTEAVVWPNAAQRLSGMAEIEKARQAVAVLDEIPLVLKNLSQTGARQPVLRLGQIINILV